MLNIIRTAIIPSLAYTFTVTPCTPSDTSNFGLGAPSICFEYHRRLAVALTSSLEDPSARHIKVTLNLYTKQNAHLTDLSYTFLTIREGTNLHIRHQLLQIPANKIAYASPQTWISQETPLPQASWYLYIIAVWNTATRLHLNKHNPAWLQHLACDIPEANWHLNNIASHPVCDVRLAETVPGLKKFEKLHSNKMQTARCSHKPALGEVAPLSHHSKPGLTLKISDWESWTYTDGSCRIQEGITVIEAGVYHPSSGN